MLPQPLLFHLLVLALHDLLHRYAFYFGVEPGYDVEVEEGPAFLMFGGDNQQLFP
jgi:hypothetical protein